MLKRESEVQQALKELHRVTLEDEDRLLKEAREDKQRLERLATSRDTRIKELQRQLADAMARKVEKAGADEGDAVSLAGFTDLSELQGSQNALDVILGNGRIESAGLAELPRLGLANDAADRMLMT